MGLLFDYHIFGMIFSVIRDKNVAEFCFNWRVEIIIQDLATGCDWMRLDAMPGAIEHTEPIAAFPARGSRPTMPANPYDQNT